MWSNTPSYCTPKSSKDRHDHTCEQLKLTNPQNSSSILVFQLNCWQWFFNFLVDRSTSLSMICKTVSLSYPNNLQHKSCREFDVILKLIAIQYQLLHISDEERFVFLGPMSYQEVTIDQFSTFILLVYSYYGCRLSFFGFCSHYKLQCLLLIAFSS